jgi:hypothetical protein
MSQPPGHPAPGPPYIEAFLAQLGGAAEHRVVVGVQGNGRGLRECSYPLCHVAGRIASRSLITYVAGFFPYPAARSGSRTERDAVSRSRRSP